MFPVRYELTIYILLKKIQIKVARVEAGSNTSTVPLRVIGGDEKGIQRLWIYLLQYAPGGYKNGELTLQVGGSLESETVNIWSWVPRDSDRRMTALARISSNCKRQTYPLVREVVT
jgi:hypothetical protein